MLHFASSYSILLNFGSHNDGCKLPSSLPHEWLAEWKEQCIIETQQKNSVGAIFTYFTPKGAFKAVLHCASFYNILFNFGSHNDGCKLPSSLPHEWLAEWKEQCIIETQQKNSVGAILTYFTPKGAFKAVLHCASFYNILFNFGSHNDGCKLPSSLPHEWLAEWKEQYIIETQQKILLAQFLHTLPLKVRVKLCCILQVSSIYCSTLAAIMMAVSFPHHCRMSGWLSGKNSIL